MIYKIKVSRILLATVAATHLGALLVAMSLALPAGVAATLALAVVVSAGRTLRVLAQLSRHSVAALRHSAHGGWELCTPTDPAWQPVDVIGCLRHPLLVIVSFRARAAGARHVPIMWDSVDADEFRQLRAVLAAPPADMPTPDRA